jgi:hypothetical protein
MKIISIVLLVLSFFPSSSVMAEEMLPADDSLLKFNIYYTQQEQGLTGVEILAPRMGRFGRLGLNLANTTYRVRDINDETQELRLHQYALAWRNEENLIGLKHNDFYRALGLVTTMRLGQTVYEVLEDVNKKESQFTFFELDALFQIASNLKTYDPTKWVKGNSIGVGSGFRVNFINRQTFIGNAEVNDIRVFPTLQVSVSFF